MKINKKFLQIVGMLLLVLSTPKLVAQDLNANSGLSGSIPCVPIVKYNGQVLDLENFKIPLN